MPKQVDVLAAMLGASEAILFDFDGPICDVFRGTPAPKVAEQLASLLSTSAPALAGISRATDDPMEVHRLSQQGGGAVLAAVEAALTAAEIRAVQAAGEPTVGAIEALHAARASGRAVAIVSNNSTECVEEYLTRHGLVDVVHEIVGRPTLRPDLMKPSPHSLLAAASAFGVSPSLTALVGDSVTDVEAARAAGARSIGYANKPRKQSSLAEAGADVVVLSMQDIAHSLAGLNVTK
ncbi:HAD family hydrolase [Streptomyces subrutilus]|uniref:Haloacid dehalogenase n=1 Tax=Streptomyces subrutilus TaxID=36818 RepID=A0A1E5PT98_9ACTN|nr:HAD family hydrolase [Streptomyces subrutilus]OEJ32673.1 haloacid dehalogenase [Streptomyces subrutilus]